jgi:hypothetical protein
MKTVSTAWSKWQLVADAYGWENVIMTDDPKRGGKLAAFVLHLLEDTDLVADSISTYVWALRWAMKLRHQADPVMGVMLWQEFMTGIRVIAHTPGEPRRALPTAVIMAIGETIDLSNFSDVQFFFFCLILYFTFSRSECPCPKHYTGPESWDDNKHWMVRDIEIRRVAGVFVLCVRFKSIKQDPRIERPTARGDGSDPGASRMGGSDWSYIGDVPNSILSPFMWYRHLMAFYDGPRPPTSPFFVDATRTRPYLYSSANRQLKQMVGRVQDDVEFAMHSFRVEGYNRAKLVAGEDLAVAHGGWKPGSNSKYDRFELWRVFSLAKSMAACDGRDQVHDEQSAVSDSEAQLAADVARVHVRASEPQVAPTPAARRERSTSSVPAILSTLREEHAAVADDDDGDEDAGAAAQPEVASPACGASASVYAAVAAAVQRVTAPALPSPPPVPPTARSPRPAPSPRRSSPPRTLRRRAT